MSLAGTYSKPLAHRDFTLDVPTYHYYPRCGHCVRYRIPLERNSYGYCHQCSDYFLFDFSVMEIQPRNCRQYLRDSEVTALEDCAILRNRIADYLVAAGPGAMTTEFAREIAVLTNTSEITVRRVHAAMGYDEPEEEVEAA